MLQACVNSVRATGAREVFVVDNDSRDGSVEALQSAICDDHLHILRNGRNLGFATACNVGVKASDAKYLLFLNPDSVLEAGALQRMLEVLAGSKSIGMVGGMLCNPDGSEQPGGRRVFPTPQRAFMRAFGLSRFSRFLPDFFSDFLLHKEPLPPEPIAVDAISGACMLVKREAIDVVGLWDERYFLHCEDLDWCMRFKLKNWQVYFVPDARIVHDKGGCSLNRPFFVNWHKHNGMLRFYRKYYKRQYPWGFWWLVVAGVWLRFCLVYAWHAGKSVLRGGQ